MKEDKWTIHLGGRINAYPVVTTGERWPAIKEGQETRSFDRALFGGFPFLKNDERWQDYGSRKDEPDNPPQGARGGGLFPVIALLPDGRIACVTRTGATHSIRPGAQLSLSFSEDRGRTWSPYRVVVEKEEDDARNPALGSSADGTLVLAYGIHSVGESRCLFEHIEVIRSLDGGETWSAPHRVEYVLVDSYWHYDCGYPSTVCFDDGTIVTVAYTIFDMAHPEWGTCAIAYVCDQEVFEE